MADKLNELYCERCHRKAQQLKMIGIMDETTKRKLMWICTECYNEHTWEQPNEHEQAVASIEGTGNKGKRTKYDSGRDQEYD